MLNKESLFLDSITSNPLYTITVGKSTALYESYQRGFHENSDSYYRYGSLSRRDFEDKYLINRLCGNIQRGLGPKGSWICFDNATRPGTIYVKRLDTNSVFTFSSWKEFGNMKGYFIEDTVIFTDIDVGKTIDIYLGTTPFE